MGWSDRMIHDDLHMMPPTTSFALDHPERLGGRDRRAQPLFNLFRTVFLFGRQRARSAAVRAAGNRPPPARRASSTRCSSRHPSLLI
jgi:hypothetical protein